MDWTPLIAVAGMVLGGIATGVVAWLGIKFSVINARAQDAAQIQIAQNRLITLQKIGQVAAGMIEQTNRNDPPETKQKLALNLATQLATNALTPASVPELIPVVEAGVALLPKTHTDNLVPAQNVVGSNG